jgi:hypothetical protein
MGSIARCGVLGRENMNAKKPQTNTEFLTEQMEFSRYGAVMQMFILTALEKYSQQVIRAGETDPEFMVNSFVSGVAWIKCAKELIENLDTRGI